MCGSGLRWTYIPTPQPNDAVIAKVCAVCGKRAKQPRYRVTKTWTSWQGVRTITDNLRPGEIGFVRAREASAMRTTRRKLYSCCSDPANHKEILGKVVRNHWSKKSHGGFSKFFLIVEDHATGRRHWATLDSCRLVDFITMLGRLADGEGRTES